MTDNNLLTFTKMHGAGNDFILLDNLTSHIAVETKLLRLLANRRLGVGCDQILLLGPPLIPDVDFNCRIFNADGTEIEQCGNGLRCLGHYIFTRKLAPRLPIRIGVANRVNHLIPAADGVRVDLGKPVFEPSAIPYLGATEAKKQYSLQLNGQSLRLSVLSLGNPHAVLQVPDCKTVDVAGLGAAISGHGDFPNGANIGFMQKLSSKRIKLRVCERGVGETPACGSGAAAAVISGHRLGILDDQGQCGILRWHTGDSLFRN